MVASQADIEAAADRLVAGGLVVFPTETVYGLGADALDTKAVCEIFAIKGRPRDRALIVHVSGVASLASFGTGIPDYARTLAEQLWPGPITLVVSRQPHVPIEVTGGGDTVGVRAPDHPVALALIAALSERRGQPSGISAPSANRFGEPAPTRALDIALDGSFAVLDGGPCKVGIPSTVVRCVDDVPTILRVGGTPVERIEAVVGRSVQSE